MCHLPQTLWFLISVCIAQVSASASLVPPSTFGTFTGSSTATSSSATLTSSGAPASRNSTTIASTTSTASFPSLSNVPQCESQCLQVAVSSGNCSSITNATCYCEQTGRTNFANTLVNCVVTQCNGGNNGSVLSDAESLANQFCAFASTSTSITFPSTTATSTSISSASSSSSTAPASSASSSPSSSSAARISFGGEAWYFLASLSIAVTLNVARR